MPNIKDSLMEFQNSHDNQQTRNYMSVWALANVRQILRMKRGMLHVPKVACLFMHYMSEFIGGLSP